LYIYRTYIYQLNAILNRNKYNRLFDLIHSGGAYGPDALSPFFSVCLRWPDTISNEEVHRRTEITNASEEIIIQNGDG
jgi:hypothetical protein